MVAVVLNLLRDPDVRRWLRRDACWVLAGVGLIYSVGAVRALGYGWDAHAYWLAARGPLYTSAPATPDAFLYSPAFAQVVSPVARLPFPVFASVFSILSALALIWLLAPLGPRVSLPLLLACTPEIVSGNIFALVAIVAVVGLTSPVAWALPALTKVTPCLGPVWFAVRGEWKHVFTSVVSTLVMVAISYLLSPQDWSAWLRFLLDHSSAVGGPVGSPIVPGPAIRVPLALALVVWGARTSRLWTLPVAMMMATPVFGFAAATICAAIPRLRGVVIWAPTYARRS